MGCMKCGRDLVEGQVFCSRCLETMNRYPVKPGTPVQLPRPRPETAARRSSPRRRSPTPEETVKRLRRKNRHLALIALFLLIAVLVLGWFTYAYFTEERGARPGQNYSSMDTQDDMDKRDVSRETISPEEKERP